MGYLGDVMYAREQAYMHSSLSCRALNLKRQNSLSQHIIYRKKPIYGIILKLLLYSRHLLLHILNGCGVSISAFVRRR